MNNHFEESQVKRDTGGRFANKPHAEADATLPAPTTASAPKPALRDQYETENDYHRALHRRALANVRRAFAARGQSPTHPSRRGVNDGIEETLANDILRTTLARDDIENPAAYLRRAADNAVAAHTRGRDRDSVDTMAQAIYHSHKEEFVAKHGRDMTREEEDELATRVRDNFKEMSGGRGKQNRKPKINFHRYGEDKTLARAQIHHAQTATHDSQEERATVDMRGRIHEAALASEKVAMRAFVAVQEQIEGKVGRPMTLDEEDRLAAAVRREWAISKEGTAPREGFHTFRSSRVNPDVTSWNQLYHDTSAPSPAFARKIAWNVLAEQWAAPPVEVGCISAKKGQEARRVIGDAKIVEVAAEWEGGGDTEQTRALFTPWPGVSLDERHEIVEAMHRHSHLANEFWRSAVALATDRTKYADVEKE